MRKAVALLVLLALIAGVTNQPVAAQAGGPFYIVQPGDTMSSIANRFNIPLNDLLAANPTIDPNLLGQGQQVLIPGLEGITGILDTEVIRLGDTLRSLSRRTQVTDANLVKLNRLVSPTELYVGISIIVPRQENQKEYTTRTSLSAGESLLELAVRQNTNPWSISAINKQAGT